VNKDYQYVVLHHAEYGINAIQAVKKIGPLATAGQKMPNISELSSFSTLTLLYGWASARASGL